MLQLSRRGFMVAVDGRKQSMSQRSTTSSRKSNSGWKITIREDETNDVVTKIIEWCYQLLDGGCSHDERGRRNRRRRRSGKVNLFLLFRVLAFFIIVTLLCENKSVSQQRSKASGAAACKTD